MRRRGTQSALPSYRLVDGIHPNLGGDTAVKDVILSAMKSYYGWEAIGQKFEESVCGIEKVFVLNNLRIG